MPIWPDRLLTLSLLLGQLLVERSHPWDTQLLERSHRRAQEVRAMALSGLASRSGNFERVHVERHLCHRLRGEIHQIESHPSQLLESLRHPHPLNVPTTPITWNYSARRSSI